MFFVSFTYSLYTFLDIFTLHMFQTTLLDKKILIKKGLIGTKLIWIGTIFNFFNQLNVDSIESKIYSEIKCCL